MNRLLNVSVSERIFYLKEWENPSYKKVIFEVYWHFCID